MIDNILETLMVGGELSRFDCGQKYGSDYGFILYHDSEFVTIRDYDQDGFYQGLKIFRTSQIESVGWNGNNMVARTKIINKVGINTDPVNVDITSFDGFLDTVSEKYGYVVVNNDGGEMTWRGPLIAHDSTFIHMISLGSPNRMDRTSHVIRKESVTSLSVDGIYERNLIMLHEGTL
jgi:hypothetical protein